MLPVAGIPKSSVVATVRMVPSVLEKAPVVVIEKKDRPNVLGTNLTKQFSRLATKPMTVSAGLTGPSQVRFAHTDVKIPDFQAYRRAQNKDAKSENKAALPSRMFTYAMTSGLAVGGVYLGKNAVQTVVGAFSATKGEMALSKVEIKLSDIPEGKSMLFKWRGKPLYVRHRTVEDIENMQNTNIGELRDPQHDSDRTKDPKWLVVLGVCTHLGCVPVADVGDYGGFYCPCHGSHYDTSGRIRKGPAPLNLEVPFYEFPEEGLLVVG